MGLYLDKSAWWHRRMPGVPERIIEVWTDFAEVKRENEERIDLPADLVKALDRLAERYGASDK